MENLLIFLVFCVITPSWAGQYGVTVVNNCPFEVFVQNWEANRGDFCLQSHSQADWQMPGKTDPNRRSPRIWGNRGCSSNRERCEGGPEYCSLAEWLFQDYGDAPFRGFTWYDVSMVDGYNLPMSMEPYVKGNPGGNCYKATCIYDLGQCAGNRIGSVGCRNRNRDAVTPYSQSVKRACPTTYTWSSDDTAGQRACPQGNTGVVVVFCP